MGNETRCGDTVNRGRELTGTMSKIFDGACRMTERGRYMDALGLALRSLYICFDSADDRLHAALQGNDRFMEALDGLVDCLVMI